MKPTPRSDQCACDMPPGDSLDAIIMALTLSRTLERELAEAVEFLENCSCPRPVNGGPYDLSIGGCMAQGECGCNLGDFLKRIQGPLENEEKRGTGIAKHGSIRQ